MKAKVLLNTVEKVKEFVNILSKRKEDFDLVSGRYIIDAKSIMGIYSLDLSKPITLVSNSADYDTMWPLLAKFIVSD